MGSSTSTQKVSSADCKKDLSSPRDHASDVNIVKAKMLAKSSEENDKRDKASDQYLKDAKVSDQHSEQQMASDEYTVQTNVRYCDPCIGDGDQSVAFGFCVDCQDCLCKMCFKSHSRNKITKYHTLLSREAIPGQAPRLCDPCNEYSEETEAEGYCGDCKNHLCEGCFLSHSRNKFTGHHILYSKSSIPAMQQETGFKQGMPNVKGHSAYNEAYRLAMEIDVKCGEKELDCFITGITLVSDNELVMTDEHNSSLKVYDIKNCHLRSLKMDAVPNRITTIAYDQVAVLFRNKAKIEILRTRDRLSTVRTLYTDGNCVDIEYVRRKLYVSYRNPIKFQVLDLTGTIKNTIIPDEMIAKNCDLPSRIAVNSDESLIFMTDWKRKTFLSMDMNGMMVSLYPTPLPEPGDIIISPFGSIYICIRKSQVIYKMTQDFKDVTVIIGSNDIVKPLAMSLDESKTRLYVSSSSQNAENRNVIKVFKRI